MKRKVLLIDDNRFFRSLWMRGIEKQFAFIQASTIQEAKELLASHADICAIVVDACMDAPLGINWRQPLRIRQWGFNTKELIAEIKQKFEGPIIAAPCQWWHFQLMLSAGCTHYCWKWRVAATLKKLLF